MYVPLSLHLQLIKFLPKVVTRQNDPTPEVVLLAPVDHRLDLPR
jgi:hypothetical protein